jgi:hypothetical protein
MTSPRFRPHQDSDNSQHDSSDKWQRKLTGLLAKLVRDRCQQTGNDDMLFGTGG